MKIEDYLRMKEGVVYLRTTNGLWKKFENILDEVLSESVVKLKKRRFMINGQPALGGRRMGKNGDEIWIYAKLSQEDRGKTLVYEVVGIHYEEKGVVEEPKDDFLEKIAEIIYREERYQRYQGIVNNVTLNFIKKGGGTA